MEKKLYPVPGFEYAAMAAGIKPKGGKDLCLIHAPNTANCAALFTTSRVKAAPVLQSIENIKNTAGKMRALLINSGNANACTGDQGDALAKTSVDLVGQALTCKPEETLIASTGVIGVPLDSLYFEQGIPILAANLKVDETSFKDAAQAIMTTDLTSKYHSVKKEIAGQEITVSGIAKGSGMIRPNMATFLGCILTDAPLSSLTADTALRTVADTTFNAVTVDGDTSTNDTFVLMASTVHADKAELITKINDTNSPEYEEFLKMFHEVALELSQAVARDGEGATKYIEVAVTGAKTCEDAKQVAFTIAESPLVKTAIFGADANWGRVAMAAGRAGVDFDQSKLSIEFASILTCKDGQAVPFSEEEAHASLSQPEVTIHVHLGENKLSQEDLDSASSVHPNRGCARVMTCDFSYDYVKINGEYRS